MGYYNLLDKDIQEAQASLAKNHGISGFCYYHYWSKGKRLLHKPIDQVLANKELDFPFCFCWANENWTRTWDGLENDVLQLQEYSTNDDIDHIRWLIEAFKDPRYIRVNNKPLLIVYRASELPNPLKTTSIWREEAKRLGIGELHLCTVESFADDRLDPRLIGFDASIGFQPDWYNLGSPKRKLKGNNLVFEYKDIVNNRKNSIPSPYKKYPCVIPGWDNSPRRANDAKVFRGSTPDLYKDWLANEMKDIQNNQETENIVFINAWNEWGEGAYLEPCSKWGTKYLEATKKAVSEAIKHVNEL